MKKLTPYAVLVARILLGGMFVFSGLNGFFNFMPMEPPQGAAGQFMGGLAATGYFFPLLKGTETLVGVALLAGRFVPLALTVLAPIMVNIVGFHLFVEPQGSGMAIGLALIQLFLAWAYRDAFVGVLSPKARPVSQSSDATSRTVRKHALEGIS